MLVWMLSCHDIWIFSPKHEGHNNEFFNGYTCCAVAASGTHHDGACAVAGDERGVEQAGVEDPRHGAGPHGKTVHACRTWNFFSIDLL